MPDHLTDTNIEELETHGFIVLNNVLNTARKIHKNRNYIFFTN